jgi:cytochrome c peroxidase
MLSLVIAWFAIAIADGAGADGPSGWTQPERALLASLSLDALPPPPPDPGNPAGDRPAAARLGERLFFEPGLSATGKVACASCHIPSRGFSDGLATSRGVHVARRNAPSLLDVAFVRALFWDGRADSLWSQALLTIESPAEMGGERGAAVARVAADPALTALYREAFGGDPAARPTDRVFADLGKALAAYQRTLRSKPTRFDRYVAAVLAGREDEAAKALTPAEVSGLRVFMGGAAGCATCHLGPLFSDGRFHNIGTGDLGLPTEDPGWATGREELLASEWNCRSRWFERAREDACAHLSRPQGEENSILSRGAFRTPGLRGLRATAPYMHDGRHDTLREVVEHYLRPPDKSRLIHELPESLSLADEEVADLLRFLHALSPDL